MKKNEWKIMVTTYPFGSSSDLPTRHLDGYCVLYNDLLRKYSKNELIARIEKFNPDIIIAGTENYTSEILDKAINLKMISRVGIGLDSVPIDECKKRGIAVCYTPDAPSNAVAELTVCQIINMLREVRDADINMRQGKWVRTIGREIRDCNIGIIGCGRIGKLMVDKLSAMKPRRILVNDIDYQKAIGLPRSEFSSKMNLLSSCDVVTLHIPYNSENKDYISYPELEIMKKDVKIVNMSRGGVVNEDAICEFLIKNPSASAAIDVFVDEPYLGKLLDVKNVYLTPHLGSCSTRSRLDMELGAAEQAVNFINNKSLTNRVI